MPPKSTPKSKSNQYPHFKPGSKVEIMSEEDGFRGSFFTGTVVKATRTSNFVVEYDKLFEDEEGTKPLQETVNEFQIRPIPPREKKREFKFSEEVDAFHNDGWWEGVITEVNDDGKFAVFFRSTKEQIEFSEENLRLHREWISGAWKPTLEGVEEEKKEEVKEKENEGSRNKRKLVEEEEKEVKRRVNKKVPDTTQVKPIESPKDAKFSKGMLVEVSSDEDGLKGAWFAATIVEPVGKDKYLIEYQALRTEDDSDFLREEIDTVHIRPCPPQTIMIDRFKKLEEVDALFNDAWWVGVVSRVNTFPKYLVFFKDSNEELEFKHSDLRPHQDWINGKWVTPSKALKL
ncbi:AGENET DOMAIN-CONTAINING PROTEIN-RELATED [Salix purpurea]|uniref:AGENET DOMAIN-CONTAINING PROTEIN-RELATED n=1 Tax=Salix purpurea TaxID=77065 RepID=A0A9Q0X0I0_SALPP|nr:AGENET DOMAIN-CONTAINING PROTEIN-RELATED [Salix purpurea]